jgi:hypothetical protein
MALAVEYNIFFEQKAGNQFHHYEDAFALAGVPVLRIPRNSTRDPVYDDERTLTGKLQLPKIWRCAVADGATGSGFSQAWARVLVEQYVNSSVRLTPDLGDVRQFLASTAGLWNERYVKEILNGYTPGTMQYLRVKNGLNESSQAAALLLLEIDTERMEWRSVALGDTLMFQFDAKYFLGQQRTFANVRGDDFGNNPVLVTTSRREQDEIIWKSYDYQHPVQSGAYAESRFEVNDSFILMTDAIAAYFLYVLYPNMNDQNQESVAFNEYDTLVVNDFANQKPSQDTVFTEWVTNRRTRDNYAGFGQMKNDDVTFVRLRMTDRLDHAVPFEAQSFPPLIEPVTDQGVLIPTQPMPPVTSETPAPDVQGGRLRGIPFSSTPSVTPPPTDMLPEEPMTQTQESALAPTPVPVQIPNSTPSASGFDQDEAWHTPAPDAPPAPSSADLRGAYGGRQPTAGSSDPAFNTLNDPALQPPADPTLMGARPVSMDNINAELVAKKRAKQKMKAQVQPAQPRPITASTAPTVRAPQQRELFVIAADKRAGAIVALNDELIRIIERVNAWDDPQFAKIDMQTQDLRQTIIGIWKQFDRNDVYTWMAATEENSLHPERKKWENKVRAEVRAVILDVVDKRGGSLEASFYLCRIIIVTWDGFQYLSGIAEVSVPLHANATDVDPYLQKYLTDIKGIYDRLWMAHKQAGGKVIPDWIRDFWIVASDYIYGKKTRLQAMNELAKMKL